MVGCFQLALVSGQSAVFLFCFQISEQKELMLALKINFSSCFDHLVIVLGFLGSALGDSWTAVMGTEYLKAPL